MYDSIVIGCGFAGAVIARELASKHGKKVLILEKRDHIGGNAFDVRDRYGIMIHQYGPHIFHTNNQKVFEYLSQFTKWNGYVHEVVGNIDEKLVPIPFNLNTLNLVYGEEKAQYLKEQLLKSYPMGAKVPILELIKNPSEDIKDLAEYVYQNIFLKYTMKQWGKTPKEIDQSVSGRVPVVLSEDNRYFQDKYQGIPTDGYTSLLKNMLQHPNIEIRLETEADQLLVINPWEEEKVLFEGKAFNGDIIYTGPIDELFGCRFGRLPYRSLDFVFEHYEEDYFQTHGVVNYTVSEEYTRITEFKYLTKQTDAKGTTIVKEYPTDYKDSKNQIPYYAIINEENQKLYEMYVQLADEIPKLHMLGRLAEYKYYNMDAIVEKALDLVEKIQ